MVELIFWVWLASLLLSAVTVGSSVYLTYQKLNSTKLKNLNSNLEKIGMFWSNASADFLPLTPKAIETDSRNALRNVLLAGLLGFASIPGFILLLIVTISVHVLARSRKEIATFKTALATDLSLTREQVEALVQELKQIR